MLTIYKYPIEPRDFTLTLPERARLLTVQTQYSRPCLWALVDPEAPPEERHFVTYGTGHPVTDDPVRLTYIGTFQLEGGMLVFHLFEKDVK